MFAGVFDGYPFHGYSILMVFIFFLYKDPSKLNSSLSFSCDFRIIKLETKTLHISDFNEDAMRNI